ncbi:MAG: hypothetical protein HDQ93_01440 [Desulfovibrio sp.]|nr:hypothetical protein [Desulfovibrio sp.]
MYIRFAILLLLLTPYLAVATEVTSNDSWFFGQSMERGQSIWKKGVGASEIKQKALPEKNKGAVDTRAGIDKAVNEAIKKGPRSSIGMSMNNEKGRWRSAPSANSPHIDEDLGRERKRVFRAYADVQGGDDWNIKIGPELILKDEQYGESSAASSEPDSALGLGMKFQYDF